MADDAGLESEGQVGMRRLILTAVLIVVSWGAISADALKVPDIHMYFSAMLTAKMTLFKKTDFSWSPVREFELLCLGGECFLEIETISAEYCDGKSKPSGPGFGGVDNDLVSNYIAGTNDLHVELIGKETLLLKFRDNILWGPTEESIIVSYKDAYPVPAPATPSSTKTPTKISGSATGFQSSAKEVKVATYQELAAPMFCTIGFWPPNN